MSYPRFIRNFNVFIDGVSYFGRATEGKLPDVKVATAAHRGAGMDGPIGIDMGLEGMTSEVSMAEWDPVLLKKLGTQQRLVFRPAAKADDATEAVPIIATIGGLVTAHELPSLKPGENSVMKLTIDVRTYRLEVDGAEIWNIDLPNGKRVVNGVDQLASIRKAMGL